VKRNADEIKVTDEIAQSFNEVYIDFRVSLAPILAHELANWDTHIGSVLPADMIKWPDMVGARDSERFRRKRWLVSKVKYDEGGEYTWISCCAMAECDGCEFISFYPPTSEQWIPSFL
jgi:hypothetical protein